MRVAGWREDGRLQAQCREIGQQGQQVQWDLLWPRVLKGFYPFLLDVMPTQGSKTSDLPCFLYNRWFKVVIYTDFWSRSPKIQHQVSQYFTEAHVRRPSPSPREAEDLRPPRPSRLVSLSPQAAVALVVGTPIAGVVALCLCILFYVCICLFS